MSTKIQFITCDKVKDAYGITSGLFNSATFVSNYFKSCGFNSILTPVTDSNGIDRVITEFNPDVVILEAIWVPPAKLAELVKIFRHSHRTWIIRIHSKAPFLANEGLAIRWIKQYTEILDASIIIAPNTEELTDQLSAAIPIGNFVYLPNIYWAKKDFKTKYNPELGIVNIGCFGAIRPMKNTFQQALAAIDFANDKNMKLNFHINASRLEQSGENVLKNLRALFEDSYHELVEHSWMSHNEFLKVIAKMDIGMQVSFSESFNIVSADFVTAEIPIVVSDDIEWMPNILKSSPTSHYKMVKKLKWAYKNKKLSLILQKWALYFYNFKAKNIWLNELKNIENHDYKFY